MADPKHVVLSTELTDFFRSEVISARSELGVQMTEMTEYYLVNLLSDFAKHEGAQVLAGNEPLALMYKKASEASESERVQLLKNLGDVALYVSGFFTESIEKSLVDVDYYVCMGGTAYSSLSSLVGQKRNGKQFAQVYGQLARDFTDLVDVLNQVADNTRRPSQDKDLLRLYDQYARTNSERARKKLVERGFFPTAQIPVTYEQ